MRIFFFQKPQLTHITTNDEKRRKLNNPLQDINQLKDKIIDNKENKTPSVKTHPCCPKIDPNCCTPKSSIPKNQ
eukprot:UN08375